MALPVTRETCIIFWEVGEKYLEERSFSSFPPESLYQLMARLNTLSDRDPEISLPSQSYNTLWYELQNETLDRASFVKHCPHYQPIGIPPIQPPLRHFYPLPILKGCVPVRLDLSPLLSYCSLSPKGIVIILLTSISIHGDPFILTLHLYFSSLLAPLGFSSRPKLNATRS